VILKNIASTSLATSSWPTIDGQTLEGSRSAAILGITSQWAITSGEEDGLYQCVIFALSFIFDFELSLEFVLLGRILHGILHKMATYVS
jgi:hypothetical protein